MSTARPGARTPRPPDRAAPAAHITWDQVFAFRMRRQLLEPRSGKRAVDVVRPWFERIGDELATSTGRELRVAVRRG